MDDDLQHRPSDIPALYEEVSRGYDVCYADFFKKKQTLVKNLGSWVAGKVAEAVLRKPREIYMSPFKIIRRDVVDEVIKYHGPFPYVDGLLFQITDNISQITVEHQNRHSGGTTHNIWKQSQVFLNLATNFSVLPLRLMTMGGLLCSGIGFLLGIYFLLVYLIKGIKVYGWTALMLVNLFFGGALLISLGMLGEYLARVLMNVNQIPQFVVKESVNYADRPASLTRKGDASACQ
jgi:undecaprenyl-phosphate 4-deoxy-4-formamido-L-arabinose transferase